MQILFSDLKKKMDVRFWNTMYNALISLKY